MGEERPAFVCVVDRAKAGRNRDRLRRDVVVQVCGNRLVASLQSCSDHLATSVHPQVSHLFGEEVRERGIAAREIE